MNLRIQDLYQSAVKKENEIMQLNAVIMEYKKKE